MSYPKKFDRAKEPLGVLFTQVTDRQHYQKENGTEQELKFKFKTPQKANYTLQRMHALYRAVRREAVAANMPIPEMPFILRTENILTFSFSKLYKQSWTEITES